MAEFKIILDDKPNLSKLLKEDKAAGKNIIGTFVSLMETAAEKKWHKLPETIHSSLSFSDVVTGTLNAVMTTKEIEPKAYLALEDDLHPLALLSDKRTDLVTGEQEYFNWRNHFVLDGEDVSQATIEAIIRKVLYLVRWFDIETVSKALMTNSFPISDPKDIAKLPFQPALKYQQETMDELHVGKFFHELGSFNCGEIDSLLKICIACNVGELDEIKTVQHEYKICRRCNAGFVVEGN